MVEGFSCASPLRGFYQERFPSLPPDRHPDERCTGMIPMPSVPTSAEQYRPVAFACTVKRQQGARIILGGEGKGRRVRQRARRFCCVTIMKMVRFLVDAIFQRVYPVVRDVPMLIALVILLGNLLVDVAYVSLHLYDRYQSVVGLIARGAMARKSCL